MNELTYSTPLPRRARKPKGPTAKYRAKRRRAENPFLAACRCHADMRDGPCKVSVLGGCDGFSELMHLRPFTRAQTRGMAPEVRHQKAFTMNGCRRHHRAYDAGDLVLAMFDGMGADGPMRVAYQGRVRMING